MEITIGILGTHGDHMEITIGILGTHGDRVLVLINIPISTREWNKSEVSSPPVSLPNLGGRDDG